MKTLVTVKEVTTVDDSFTVDETGIPEQYLDYELNEWDDYAIAAANELTDDDESEVVAVTIGPERAEETIRQALAKGADRAIRIWDDALADQSLLDVATKANILAAVVERENPDLILTGTQASDDSFGATGVALAEAIDFGWAAVVTDVDVNTNTEQVQVQRELEGGVEELTEVALPAVLTIQTGITELEYASLRGIRQAQSKELTTYTLADLGIDTSTVGCEYTLTHMYQPDSDSDATFFDGEPAEQASRLAGLLNDLEATAE